MCLFLLSISHCHTAHHNPGSLKFQWVFSPTVNEPWTSATPSGKPTKVPMALNYFTENSQHKTTGTSLPRSQVTTGHDWRRSRHFHLTIERRPTLSVAWMTVSLQPFTSQSSAISLTEIIYWYAISVCGLRSDDFNEIYDFRISTAPACKRPPSNYVVKRSW